MTSAVQLKVRADATSKQDNGSLVLAQESCGLALKLAYGCDELDPVVSAKLASVDWNYERGAMYDEIVDELQATKRE